MYCAVKLYSGVRLLMIGVICNSCSKNSKEQNVEGMLFLPKDSAARSVNEARLRWISIKFCPRSSSIASSIKSLLKLASFVGCSWIRYCRVPYATSFNALNNNLDAFWRNNDGWDLLFQFLNAFSTNVQQLTTFQNSWGMFRVILIHLSLDTIDLIKETVKDSSIIRS